MSYSRAYPALPPTLYHDLDEPRQASKRSGGARGTERWEQDGAAQRDDREQYRERDGGWSEQDSEDEAWGEPPPYAAGLQRWDHDRYRPPGPHKQPVALATESWKRDSQERRAQPPSERHPLPPKPSFLPPRPPTEICLTPRGNFFKLPPAASSGRPPVHNPPLYVQRSLLERLDPPPSAKPLRGGRPSQLPVAAAASKAKEVNDLRFRPSSRYLADPKERVASSLGHAAAARLETNRYEFPFPRSRASPPPPKPVPPIPPVQRAIPPSTLRETRKRFYPSSSSSSGGLKSSPPDRSQPAAKKPRLGPSLATHRAAAVACHASAASVHSSFRPSPSLPFAPAPAPARAPPTPTSPNTSLPLPLSASVSRSPVFLSLPARPLTPPQQRLPPSPPPTKLSPGDPNPAWLEAELFGPVYGTWTEGMLGWRQSQEEEEGERKGGRKRYRDWDAPEEEGDAEDAVGEGVDYVTWSRRRKKAGKTREVGRRRARR
ncbi:hypothetical protein JCM8097_001709 [Rhodosporidiobolus ruineniae]